MTEVLLRTSEMRACCRGEVQARHVPMLTPGVQCRHCGTHWAPAAPGLFAALPRRLEPEVGAFAGLMLDVLGGERNADKGDPRTGGTHAMVYLSRLRTEVHELDQEVMDLVVAERYGTEDEEWMGRCRERIGREAADVGAYAMFLALLAGALPEGASPGIGVSRSGRSHTGGRGRRGWSAHAIRCAPRGMPLGPRSRGRGGWRRACGRAWNRLSTSSGRCCPKERSLPSGRILPSA